MSLEKQYATQRIVSIKVAHATMATKAEQDVAPVTNEWDNTLDDLRDDPDFAEVRHILPEETLELTISFLV